MFAIIVTEKGGDQRRLEFDKSEVTIGRVQGNDIILPKGNVSKRHARIVLKDGKFIIVDLKSTNGTYVNGRKITSPLVVKENDKIYIGDFILGVDEGRAPSYADPMPAPPPPAPAPPPPAPPMPPPRPEPPAPPPMAPPQPQMAPPQMAPPQMAPPQMVPPQPVVPPPMAPPGPPPPAPQPIAQPPRPEPPPPAPPPPEPPRPTPRTHPPRPAPGGPPPPAPSTAGPGPGPSPMPSPIPSPMPGPSPSLSSVPSPSPAVPRPAPRLVGAGARRAGRPKPQTIPPRVQIDPLDPKVIKMLDLQEGILDRLVAKLDLDNIPLDRLGDEALWQRAESAIVDLVETLDSNGELPKYVDQDSLIKEALNESLGLGPLEDLLADESIDEIIVDRRDRILVSSAGTLRGSGKAFSSDETFRRVVERLVAPSGHRIDEANPLVDVRLRDGSRLAAAVPPVAVRGACLTLRKPRVNTYSLSDLIGQGSISAEMGDFLTTCVAARRNILVCGAPGAGKSAILAALSTAAPEGERIVSVEEVSELSLNRDDWIALEARPSDGNGVPAVDLEKVLRSALRMRPDRLVVGDVRGAEALELISAMASSNDGTIASIAGDGAKAALARLVSMARLAAPGSNGDALRELASMAIDVVVHVARFADGVFRIVSIDEVTGASPGGFETQQLFCFRGTDGDGGFAAAGVIPSFYADLEARGIPADTSIFRT